MQTTENWSFMPRSLEEYDVNLVNGFTPEQTPLSRLPDEYYSPWEDLVSRLTDHLLAGRFRERVLQLPLLSIDRLTCRREYQRAYVVLTFLAHSYVWGLHQKAEDVIPECIAVPLWQVSRYLGIKPVVTNASVVLWNWEVLDTNRERMELDNLASLITFTGSPDEAWFYLVSVAIEAKGGEILRDIGKAISNVGANNMDGVTNALLSLAKSIVLITKILNRMYEKNDPYMFYWKIRQYLAGWENMKDAGLEHGVMYEGAEKVDDTYLTDGSDTESSLYKKYPGGSAAQSSVLQAIDVALGIAYYPTSASAENARPDSPQPSSRVPEVRPPQNHYLLRMRDHMPSLHKLFLEDLAGAPGIRRYVLENTRGISKPSTTEFTPQIEINENLSDGETTESAQPSKAQKIGLIKAYNNCISALKAFRSSHIFIVKKYVVEQARSGRTAGSSAVNSRDASPVGDRTRVNSPIITEKIVTVTPKAVVNGLAQAVEEGKAVVGTGGTDAIEFLSSIRNKTGTYRI
ncbi:Indoleamine 2,3-dioxygenase [Zancudomyces culisetae]|uniref:Indoleamine 2,3-dioxygenase n=1 Tax=Zancudomyces culisetae TaxID=1213189 RepID=A0A1R1PZ96_ZANCU|nr:Indoleamine 2,3-dioxygenase [Zancudomyces culisetae]|eukprot:OMH86288.1 Indoleamine 2,3-dioxygenase [Zancudomyces culisetae]